MARIARKTTPAPVKTEPEVDETVRDLVKEFKAKFGRDPKVTLAAIQEMADKEGDNERTLEEWLDAIRSLEGDDGKEKTPHITNAEALKIATKLSASASFLETVQELVKSKEQVKRLPAQAALTMSKTLTKEERAAMPVPGSRKSDPNRGNKPYDLDKVGEPGYYQDLWSGFPFAAQIIKDIESCKGSDGKVKGPRAKADLAMYTQRRKNGIEAVKNGYNILAKMDAIHDHPKLKLKCAFRLDKEDENKIDRTTSPIMVYPEGDQTGVQFYSIGEFLGVKLDVVAKQETAALQMDAFKIERKTKGKETAAPIVVNSINSAVEAIYCLARVFTHREDRNIVDGLLKQLTSAGSDDLLLNMHHVISQLEGWIERPSIKARLADLLDKQDADEKGEEKVAA